MVSNQTIIIRALAKNLKGMTYSDIVVETELGYWKVASALQQLKNRRLVRTLINKNGKTEVILLFDSANALTRNKRLCPDWQEYWEDEWREYVKKIRSV